MCNSVSGSTEFEKGDFSKCAGNAPVRVNEGWKRGISLHVEVNQVREQERIIERRELENGRVHA